MRDRPTVVIELAADTGRARDLAAGGVLVPGCTLDLNAECELVVRGAAGELRLDARVVFQDPQHGAGLELMGFGPEMKEQLAALAPPAPTGDDRREDDWAAEWTDDGAPGGPEDGEAPRDEQGAAAEDDALAIGSGEVDVPAEGDASGATAGGGGEEAAASLPVHERLRGLSLAQQIKRAHSGDLQERILLERFYGKNVWESLLRNPRLTAPEVARIARMGQLPRPLIEIIVGNGAWLQIGEVRRALLANPRLGTDQILRVLRLLPKHELKLAAVQTTYPHAVREAARRMLRELQQ